MDEQSRQEAARTRGSWNIFHLPTAIKVDLYILRDSEFDLSEFSRRQQEQLIPGESITVKSAEDSVARNLLWFRQGVEVSSNQWRDVVQVLRVAGSALDLAYVRRWAERLEVVDLFERALAESAG